MSRLALVTVNWADGEYPFCLKIKQLIELQEKCDAGPAYILQRLQLGHWRVQDVRETIRLGLIGGGMDPTAALKLTQDYVDDYPLGSNVQLAEIVVAAAIVGAPEEDEDDAPGKHEADLQGDNSKEENSAGPHTSEPDSLQDLDQQTSSPAPFGSSASP